jgi:phage terminase large subunit GpA-like protein
MAREESVSRVDRRALAAALRRGALGGDAAATRRPAVSLLEWGQRIREPKTGPLDFGRFPFQRELYEDAADVEEIAVMKATQVGASAWLVRDAIYWAAHGASVLYAFPTEEHLRPFYNARIAPLLGDPQLAKRVARGSVSNVNQRQIGNGWLNLRGAQTVAGARVD